MKKTYFSPEMAVVKIELHQLIAASVTVNVDEMPSLEPPTNPMDLIDPTGALSRINNLTGGGMGF